MDDDIMTYPDRVSARRAPFGFVRSFEGGPAAAGIATRMCGYGLFQQSRLR
jgi:hypothetical protein